MSNRLKKIKRKKKKTAPIAPIRIIEELFTEETIFGIYTGTKRGDRGWMVLHDYIENPGPKILDPMVHTAFCKATGELYAKPFSGRYMESSDSVLKEFIEDMEKYIFSQKGMSYHYLDPETPLWFIAEDLELTLEYETWPPCGCPSKSMKNPDLLPN